MQYFFIYLALVNLLSVIVTVRDKKAAECRRRRIAEKTLFFFALIGGSPAMYLTMLVIRHKTRKPLFMIGIPVIFLLELAIVFAGGHYVLHVF